MPWAAVAGAVITAYASSRDKDKESKDNKTSTELGFQRQAWLDEKQRKWGLEDRQYKEDAIAGFRGFAPESANTFNGVAFNEPERTSTEGLADFDPNRKGAINRPKPLMGAGG